jgi:hypothetical protein
LNKIQIHPSKWPGMWRNREIKPAGLAQAGFLFGAPGSAMRKHPTTNSQVCFYKDVAPDEAV